MSNMNVKNYGRVVAIKEMSAGNESVGSMWNETKTFDKDVPIGTIIEWAKGCSGKLIITIDEDSINSKDYPF